MDLGSRPRPNVVDEWGGRSRQVGVVPVTFVTSHPGVGSQIQV